MSIVSSAEISTRRRAGVNYVVLAAGLLTLCLGACGQKGDLYHPERSSAVMPTTTALVIQVDD